MKANDRKKVQRSLDQILAGNFHENELEYLLIRLREEEYCEGHPIFREIADFVAHAKRDKGITVKSLRRFCLDVTYGSSEYCRPGNQGELNFNLPIPLYLKYFVYFRVDDYNHNEIFQRFHVNPKQLKDHIRKLFKEDKKTNTAVLIKSEVKSYTSEALDFLTKHFSIKIKPVFTSDAFMTDLACVLHKNNFPIKKEVIMAQRAKIILCVMLLIHRSEFEFYGISPVRCIISNSFGPLGVEVFVPFIGNDGSICRASHEIFTSDLSPNEFCDNSLGVDEEFNLDQDLCLKDFRLSAIHS